MINFSLLLSTIRTYFYCISIDVGSDRDMQYGSPNAILTIAHVCAAYGVRRIISGREKLSRTKVPDLYVTTGLVYSEETWPTSSQAAADARGTFATRRSTLPVILRCVCANCTPTGFQSFFARNVFLDSEDPVYTSHHVDGSGCDTECN